MSSSLSLEEKLEEALTLNAEKDAQLEYLRKQLDRTMKMNRREFLSTPTSSIHEPSEEEVESSHDSHEEEEMRPRRREQGRQQTLDFRVEIPEFEGHLNPDEFLDWLNTVERVFNLKDVPDDKRVKLVALKLRKYASIWWSNVEVKRVRKGKEKARSWRKMK